MTNKKSAAFILLSTLSAIALASGNETIESFSKAKKILEREIHFDHRTTVYCEAPFDERKTITLPDGFTAQKHAKRAHRVEWEHIVPAENFGRAFTEWREGDERCVDSKGRSFKGRKCAEKANRTFRLMQADMHNLWPAIGAVNALRSNLNFGLLPGAASSFGSCPMKIDGRRAEPPEAARGIIGRTYLYMENAYPLYRMSDAQRKLMTAWSRMHPVTEFECVRERRIERIQGNANTVTAEACRAAGL